MTEPLEVLRQTGCSRGHEDYISKLRSFMFEVCADIESVLPTESCRALELARGYWCDGTVPLEDIQRCREAVWNSIQSVTSQRNEHGRMEDYSLRLPLFLLDERFGENDLHEAIEWFLMMSEALGHTQARKLQLIENLFGGVPDSGGEISGK